MPKKTTILILILAVVTAVLVYLAVSSGNNTVNQNTTGTTPSKAPAEKTAKVFFSPQNLDLSAGPATASPTVDIIVDSGTGEISGVQAELQYDPKAITNVAILPAADAASFFGAGVNVLFNDVDTTTGRISLAVAVPPGSNGIKGVGKIATLTFQRAIGGPSSTTVSFLNKTLVTMLGENESILKETMPLNVTFSQTTQFVPPPPITTTAPVVTTAPPVQ